MKFLLIIFVCFGFTFGLSAQVTDETKQGTSIPAVESDNKVKLAKEGSENTMIKDEESLALPVKKYTDNFDLTKKKKGFTMIHESDLIDPGVILSLIHISEPTRR